MSYPMNLVLWQKINDFTPDEFGCEDMDGILIYTLQQMRRFVGRKIIIHCGYEKRSSGYHPKKCACDLHIDGMHVVDQFLVANRFSNFGGIGVYSWWNSPGLHIDTRPANHKLNYDARWGSLKKGEYVPLNRKFFKEIMG